MQHRGDIGRTGRVGSRTWTDRPTLVHGRSQFWHTYPGFPPLPGSAVWESAGNGTWHAVGLDDWSVRWQASIDKIGSGNGRTFIIAGSKILAVDPASGAVHWRQRKAGGPRHGWPAVDNNGLYLDLDGSLVCLELRSGVQRWRGAVVTDAATDRISGFALGTSVAVAVTTGGQSDKERYAPRIVALDRASGARRWAMANEPQSGFEYGVAVCEDVAYAIDRKGQLFALGAGTGELIWEVSTGIRPATGVGAAVAVDGSVVLVPDRHSVAAYHCRDGSAAWVQQVGGPPTAPLLCGRSVVLTAAGNLTGLDVGTGRVLWQHELRSANGSRLVGTDDHLIATGQGIEVFARHAGACPNPGPQSKLRPV